MPYQTLDADGLRSGQTVYDERTCGQCCEEFDGDYEGGYCGECDGDHCGTCGMCESTCSSCGRYESDCDCDGDGYGTPSGVHNYSYRPNPYIPKGEFRGDGFQALLGVELEVGGRARNTVRVVRAYDATENHLYLKEDGSIEGVEIVTHPMTLQWSQTFPFARMIDDLAAAGCYVDDGYGLHVHVSRNAFRTHGRKSATHQLAWLMFLYRNSAQCSLLARRESDQWASFRTPDRGELKRKAGAHNGDREGDRYVAINCQNDRTYELRFFAATLDPEEFLAALEFADATVEYTRGVKTADVLKGDALSWGHFADWVATRPVYANLHAQIQCQVGDDRGGKFTRPNGRIAPVIRRRRRPVDENDVAGGLNVYAAMQQARNGGVITCETGPMHYDVRLTPRSCGCCYDYALRNVDTMGVFGDDFHDAMMFRSDNVWTVYSVNHNADEYRW